MGPLPVDGATAGMLLHADGLIPVAAATLNEAVGPAAPRVGGLNARTAPGLRSAGGQA